MTEFARFTITPLYGQISIGEPGTEDLPDWDTGDEAAISTEHAVLVATRSDLDGKVEVRVVDGPAPGLREVFGGSLVLSVPALEIGNIPSADLHGITLRTAGAVALWVGVDAPGAATEVVVRLGSGAVVAPSASTLSMIGSPSSRHQGREA